MSLSELEDAVGAFAELISREQDPALIWPSFLSELQSRIGFDAGYIAASWGSAFEGRGAVLEHDDLYLKRNLGRLLAEYNEDEVARHTDRTERFQNVWSEERRRNLTMFKDVLSPLATRAMIVRASTRGANIAGFQLERRGCSCKEFSDADLMLVDGVAPLLHLVEVLTLHVGGSPSAALIEEYGMSAREAEFATLATRGLQNREIALYTKVTRNTVRNSLARVFKKMGVSNRAELTYVIGNIGASETSGASPYRSKIHDGLQIFTEHVRKASVKGTARLSSVLHRSPKIVYTPPMLPVVFAKGETR